MYTHTHVSGMKKNSSVHLKLHAIMQSSGTMML